MMKISYSGRTHTGRRANNEDALLARPELGLFAVADGMGGYEGGEVASRAAVDAMDGFFSRSAGDPDLTWPFGLDRALTFAENLLRVAVYLANKAVFARKEQPTRRMGSTVAALLLRDGDAVVAHVGDSRVYRLRDGNLDQLTRDHSLYEEVAKAADGDPPPRSEYPYANVITRALGTPCPEPDLRHVPLRPGDLFLICSDGLTEKLERADLLALLAEPSLDRASSALVEHALAAGAKDNVTVVLARVEEV